MSKGTIVLTNLSGDGADDQAKRHESYVLTLFRLFKQVTVHQINNHAVLRGLAQAEQDLADILAREQSDLSALFAGENVFVNGQPLKASRATYETATELGRLLDQIGVNEVRVRRGATADDLQGMLRGFLAARQRSAAERGMPVVPSDTVRLQYVDPSYLLGGEEEELTHEEQVMRTFASAIVVMRRVFESMERGNYRMISTVKRIAQRLVMLAEEDTSALRTVTALRGATDDSADRSVTTAIIATITTRLLTRDLHALSRVALSALLMDAGRARLKQLRQHDDDPFFTGAGTIMLGPEELARLPASTAVALSAMAGLHTQSSKRLTVTFEAQWMQAAPELGALYGGKIAPTLEAIIVRVAERFDALLAYDPSLGRQRAPDDAVEQLAAELGSRAEKLVAQLMLTALDLYPRGTAVRMSSGFTGVVLANAFEPLNYGRPWVRFVLDPQGLPLASPMDIDLSVMHERVVRLGTIDTVLHDQLPEIVHHTRRAVLAGEVAPPEITQPDYDEPESLHSSHDAPSVHSMLESLHDVQVDYPEEPDAGALEANDLDDDAPSLTLSDHQKRKLRMDRLRKLSDRAAARRLGNLSQLPSALFEPKDKDD